MADGEDADTNTNEDLSWSDLTVPQLKDELAMRNLETTGKKADLVARLEQFDRDMAAHQDDNGDEFVEWNADDDVDPDGEADADVDDEYQKEISEKLRDGEEELDEPSDDAEPAAGDIDQAAGGDSATKEKGIEKEFTVIPSKEKDMFFLIWSGKKIAVPFREEVLRDIRHCSRLQNIIIYPVQLVDLFSNELRPLILSAINVSTELDEMVPGQPIKGYLRLKFGSVSAAYSAMELLKQYHRDGKELTLKHFAEDDSEGHVLSKIKKEDAGHRGPLLNRLLYVGNLPTEVSEEELKNCFNNSVRILMPGKEDSSEKLGHAYVEYATEEEANEAAKLHRNIELSGHKLYVIKSMTERVNNFGLLKDSLRNYWLDQIKSLEAVKAKAHSKSPREAKDVEAKLLRIKQRIKKDNLKRELLTIPVPESEVVDIPEGVELEEKSTTTVSTKEEKKSVERRPSARRESKPERRRSPPYRRRPSPPYRGRGSSRGFRGGPSGYRGPSESDRLVNQLQELVGALAHRGRSSDFSSSFRGHGSYYDVPPSRGGRGSGYSSEYRDYPGSRYGLKRPADDYRDDRKRHEPDIYYRGSGRGGSYGSFRGSHRGSGYY